MRFTSLATVLLAASICASQMGCAATPVRDALPGENLPEPVPVSRPPFMIPDRLLRKEQEASLRVRVLVEGSGRVEDVEVIASDPEGALDRNALRSVRRWKYRPFDVDGVEVRRWTRPVEFRFYINRCPEADEPDIEIFNICADAVGS